MVAHPSICQGPIPDISLGQHHLSEMIRYLKFTSLSTTRVRFVSLRFGVLCVSGVRYFAGATSTVFTYVDNSCRKLRAVLMRTLDMLTSIIYSCTVQLSCLCRTATMSNMSSFPNTMHAAVTSARNPSTHRQGGRRGCSKSVCAHAQQHVDSNRAHAVLRAGELSDTRGRACAACATAFYDGHRLHPLSQNV